MPRQILEQLERMARTRPEACAITVVAPTCSAQRSMTYAELHEEIAAAANALRVIGNAGDVVMLCAANQPAFITAFLGTMRAGMTIFPVHPGLTIFEIAHAASRAGARMLIAPASKLQALEDLKLQLINIDELVRSTDGRSMQMQSPALDGGLMLQTSGTTGSPKIVYRSGKSLDAVARNVIESAGLLSSDRVLAAMPLCHSYGVENGLLAPILAGAAIHLADGFDPASVSTHFATRGITVFPGVPFMYQVLAERNAQFEMPTLRLAYSAGGLMPPQIAEVFRMRYGLRIGQLYGSTEIGSVTFGNPHQMDLNPEGVGKPMCDVAILILDPDEPRVGNPLPQGIEGLVAVSAPSMLDHYVDESQPALLEGYFLTGDLGRLNEGGNLIITGRLKLQIDIGGMKVNPVEVEQVLSQHPDVRECVVVPDPVTQTLNRLKAIVSLRQPHNGSGAEQLREFVRLRLASYKVPRLIEFRDALPKSPTGKVLREAVRCG